MKKMLLSVLKIMILQFVAIEGQMAPNPHTARNSRPAFYNSDNNNPTNFNPYNNRSPGFNSDNNNSTNFNPYNNRSPEFNLKNNRSPEFNPNGNRSPFNPNRNRSSYFNPNRNRSPGFNPNRNLSPEFNPNNNRSPVFNPSNNRSPDFNSNDNYNPRYSGNNNQNHHLKRFGRPRNRHHGGRAYPNDEYSENNAQGGQSAPDPDSTRNNHPPGFLPSNDNPSNSNAPNDYNPAYSSPSNNRPNFPFYIYYKTDPLKSGRIVCLFNTGKYLKSGFKPTMIPARLCTIVNYEFATLNSTTYEISPGNPDLDYGQKFYNKTVGLKYFNPYLKVMLSLGGWTDSTKKYSDLVASSKKVDNFITKAVQFLQNHGFDGLDVAWEYPNCWQGALGVSPQDKPNFVKFLKKIRKAFDDKNLLLSISVSAIKREIKAGYNGTEIAKAVHYINVMTYDMHGPWEKKTGHHTQFDKKANDSDPTLNSKAAMEYWTSIGVPKAKLNMGIATYATTFTLKDPTNHELGALSTGPGKTGALSHSGGTLYYREICQYINAGNWTEEQDKDVGFYAYSGDQWAGYDHPLMVVRKVKWIADNGFGGLLIKDVSGDDYEMKCFAKRFPLIWIAGMEFTRALKGKK